MISRGKGAYPAPRWRICCRSSRAVNNYQTNVSHPEIRLHILEAIVEERRRDRRVVLMLEKQKTAAAVGPKKVHRGRSIFVPISPQRSRRVALLQTYAFPSIFT
jgi:hypothetical protein